jgi:Spy/CpxP family protein refolding chaperone
MSWHWKSGLAAMALAATVTLLAQAGGGGFGGGGGGFGGGGFGGGGGPGGGGGGFGRTTTIDSIRQQVAFADDEWTVIQPRLQRVLDAQTALGIANTRGFGGRGGFGGGQPANAAQTNPVQLAQQELSATLQDQGSPTDVIAAKLKALRDARSKAKADLAVAQDDLKKVLTIRQEAMLVNMGYLE